MALIAGVDEAGRGPLAGPVVAAAVILPEDHMIKGLRDSKELSKSKRETLFPIIHEQSIGVGVGQVGVKIIDEINIREATLKAMQIALGNLPKRPDKALIDGHPLKNQIIPNEGVVGGDDLIDSIKAASIIAKVTRDRIMEDYGRIFPEYGFEKHNGYGTKVHMDALDTHRATPIHRRSFKPVKYKLPTLTWLSDQTLIDWMGEKLAALNLYEKGMKVLEMNRNCPPHGEIDIIAMDEDEIVFIDVKTGYKTNPNILVEEITQKRITQLIHAIQAYQDDMEQKDNFRIDSMAVFLKKDQPMIKHFKGIHLD
jgi:ribonuclease HII